MSLNELVKDIIADGVVDADEVQQLETALYADGVIDSEEVDALFTINDAVSGNANSPLWTDLFVKAVSENILDDGVIDFDEVAYLVEKIQGDGAVDATEVALLENLKSNCQGEFPAELASLLV